MSSGLLFRRRTRLPFEAPILGVAGTVRRGLPPPVAGMAGGYAPSAALLAALLGLLRKRLIRVASVAPASFVAADDMTRSRHSRRLAAAERGVALFSWEHPLLDAVVARKGAAFGAPDLSDVTSLLERRASPRVGDDGAATRRWVSERIERGWVEIERPAGLDDRRRAIDLHLEWLALDPAFVERLDETYTPPWLEVLALHGGSAARLNGPFTTWAAGLFRNPGGSAPRTPPPAASAG